MTYDQAIALILKHFTDKGLAWATIQLDLARCNSNSDNYEEILKWEFGIN